MDSRNYAEFFRRCSLYISDPYWKSIFTGMIDDTYIPRFSRRGDSIVFRYAKKYSEVAIPNDPQEAISVIINFMRSNGGLHSANEATLTKVSSDTLTWTKIKSKGELLRNRLRLYCWTICTYLNCPEKFDHLYLMLCTASLCGSINDVQIDDGYITNIPNVSYDQGNKSFILSHSAFSCTNTVKQPTKTKENASWRQFGKYFGRYCDSVYDFDQ